MRRDELLEAVLAVAHEHDAAVFVSNGANCRAVHQLKDGPNIFYMLGSMGVAPALAAGYQRAARRPVVVLEGDGNALMGLSGMPVVVSTAPGPFVHLLLDNGRFDSTGGQRTLGSTVSFPDLARAAGYPSVHAPAELPEVVRVVRDSIQRHDVTFAHVPVDAEFGVSHPRVAQHPREITDRFAQPRRTRAS